MPRVFLYGCLGTYSGNCEFRWTSPPIGGKHKFILFFLQDDDSSPQDAATEVARFGFEDVQISTGKPIDVESLNEPAMHVFRKHYEGAFAEGSSIVWYP